MATIHDVAEKAGVSIATVSRAFSGGTINEHTREQIHIIANQLNYSPKKYRRHGMNISKHSMIGVIISCHNYPWFNLILSGINSILEEKGITPIFADTCEDPYKDVTNINKLKDIVCGLLVVSSTEMDSYCTDFLKEINRKVPVVTMIRNTNIPTIDSILIDSFRSTYEGINLLLENGHHHVGIINGPMTFKLSFDRLAAYTEALTARGIPIRSDYVCYGSFKEEHACELATSLIKNNPQITAIFSANTAITRGCLKAFEQCGLSIPSDIAFLSYGDEFSFGLNRLSVSVISDPDYDIGRQAAELLLWRMSKSRSDKKRDPERIIITPEIILRGSERYPSNRA